VSGLMCQVMIKRLINAYRDRREHSRVTARIGVKGMTTKRCARTVRKALLTKSGVKQVLVDLKSGVASVTYDPLQTDLPALHQIILRKGYFPQEMAVA